MRKMMRLARKIAQTLGISLLAALVLAGSAMAWPNCPPLPEPALVVLDGQGDTAGFVNNEQSLTQGISDQKIDQVSLDAKCYENSNFSVSGYGALELGPAVNSGKAFGKLTGNEASEHGVNVTLAKVDAKVQNMDQGVVGALNGAVAIATTGGASGNIAASGVQTSDQFNLRTYNQDGTTGVGVQKGTTYSAISMNLTSAPLVIHP
jgi:hypothetical protein